MARIDPARIDPAVNATTPLYAILATLDCLQLLVCIASSSTGDGLFDVTCSRLVGDTFKYHHVFQELCKLLPDIVFATKGCSSICAIRAVC